MRAFIKITVVFLITLTLIYFSCTWEKSPLSPPGGEITWTLDTTLVQKMVGRVSQENIRGYIQFLQDLGTRYSGTQGCRRAGQWLYDTFSEMGLEVDFHRYLPYGLSDIFFIDQSRGWIVGGRGDRGLIFYTQDGGYTWRIKENNLKAISRVFFIDEDTGWIIPFEIERPEYYIYHTSDGGDTWEGQQIEYSPKDIYFVNKEVGWVSTLFRIYSTTDGGTNWILQFISLNGVEDIFFTDPNNGWAVGRDGYYYHTQDGGWHWSEGKIEGMDSLIDVYFTSPDTGFIVGMPDKILRTTDGGKSWEAYEVEAGGVLYKIDFVDSKHGWVVGFGALYYTPDGGETWVRREKPFKSNLIEFISVTKGFSLGGMHLLFTTSDGGQSWDHVVDRLFVDEDMLWKNVVAVIPGKIDPEREVIMCAHYDSYARGSSSAPGANDNATGVAAVVETARILRNYNFASTIKFICFSGEEQIMLGSKCYAYEASWRGDHISAVLNFDMIGCRISSDRDLNLWYGYHSDIGRSLALFVKDVGGRYTELKLFPKMAIGGGWLGDGLSDDIPFHWMGYPAIGCAGLAYDYPWLHTPYDTIDKIDLEFTTEVVKLAVASVATLAEPLTRVKFAKAD